MIDSLASTKLARYRGNQAANESSDHLIKASIVQPPQQEALPAANRVIVVVGDEREWLTIDLAPRLLAGTPPIAVRLERLELVLHARSVEVFDHLPRLRLRLGLGLVGVAVRVGQVPSHATTFSNATGTWHCRSEPTKMLKARATFQRANVTSGAQPDTPKTSAC